MKLFLFLTFLAVTILHSQNIILTDTQNQYDYVIITIQEFTETCEIFKQHKESYNNFSVLITTKDQILNEFKSNSNVQENIRDFISYAGKNWSEPKPNYFLLAASVDSIPNFSFRSVNFDSYNDTSYSDYYYGVDTSEVDSSIVSYSIGRIAARNNLELENYFDKVIKYESENETLPWNRKSLFVTDDFYGADSTNEGDIFINMAHSVVDRLPDFINTKFIIPIDTSKNWGDTNSIITNLSEGVSSAMFIGHCNDTIFTHDSIFTISDVSKLQNNDKSFFITVLGGQQFSREGNTSIVNEMILSQNGALASINSVGIHFVSASGNLYESIWELLYSGIPLGEVYLNSINNYQSFTEKRKYNLFGDPSIILKTDFTSKVENKTSIIPTRYVLEQNYPNPFNPATTIKYSIPNLGTSSDLSVQLKVYDVLGNEVTTLVNERKGTGTYQVIFDGSKFSSGVYFYKLVAGNYISIKKMLLLK